MASSNPTRRIAIVIPARNEESRIGQVLGGLERSIDAYSVVPLVVDDGSADRTAAVAQSHGAHVIRHAVNLGKGAALKTGCEAAIGSGCDLITLMDADGQHLPQDVRPMVAPILAGEADLVLARRRLSREMPATMRFGNWGLSQLFALLFGVAFTDTQCGFRAFTAAAYRKLEWASNDYAVETEMLVKAARARLRTREVEIHTIYHDAYKGTTVSDGVRILGQMLRWRIGV